MPSCCITHLPSLDRFEALRVLDFEGCVDLKDCDMKGMDKLFQLKYLSFRGTGISKLPAGIVMLGNLETLEFMNTDVEELP
uniref:Disease resistance R13L4/SHOC-2-like LRR domain-containing protein n=2 Tax=Aegilops tauschii TaxID=37682 RepID=A0A453MLT2_AEGTS